MSVKNSLQRELSASLHNRAQGWLVTSDYVLGSKLSSKMPLQPGEGLGPYEILAPLGAAAAELDETSRRT
jgi:hypothetical protein